MKLFRTINSQFDPNQPFIRWEGDVRGIIAAMCTADKAERIARHRPRMIGCVANIRRIVRVIVVAPMEVAA